MVAMHPSHPMMQNDSVIRLKGTWIKERVPWFFS